MEFWKKYSSQLVFFNIQLVILRNEGLDNGRIISLYFKGLKMNSPYFRNFKLFFTLSLISLNALKQSKEHK